MFVGSKVRRVSRADNLLDNVGSLTKHTHARTHTHSLSIYDVYCNYNCQSLKLRLGSNLKRLDIFSLLPLGALNIIPVHSFHILSAVIIFVVNVSFSECNFRF
jgi:hypothetical protein